MRFYDFSNCKNINFTYRYYELSDQISSFDARPLLPVGGSKIALSRDLAQLPIPVTALDIKSLGGAMPVASTSHIIKSD